MVLRTILQVQNIRKYQNLLKIVPNYGVLSTAFPANHHIYPAMDNFIYENHLQTGTILIANKAKSRYWCACKLFCTGNKHNTDYSSAKKATVLKEFIESNKEKLSKTEKRLKEKVHTIAEDVRLTKNKMKKSMGIIIERENVYTIPNFLCVLRIGLSPYLGMLIVQDNFHFALGLLGFAAVTDFLDGWIARTWESQSSKMGSFLDPMADKVLIATLFLSLTYADLIPIALTSVIVARDVILIIAGFVIRYKSLPPPVTLSRYFDVSHATAQLAPTFISKVNTNIQLLLVGSTLAAPVFHYVGHPALECLWYVTGASTIAAALSYLLSKNTYKILRKRPKPE